MTPQRLRTKLRKIREHGEEMAEEGGELNLVPYLDIVTNVIMFMLATTTFAAALGDINVTSPTTSSGASASQSNSDQPKNELNLTVSVTEKGFTIAAAGAVLYQNFSFDAAGNLTQPSQELPTVPKKPNGDYDYELLNKKMLEIRRSPAAAGESKVLVNANPNIIYDILVQTLDACRGKATQKPDPANPGKTLEVFEGFGDVSLMAGVN
jgi:biopolymer transport protein ExbD